MSVWLWTDEEFKDLIVKAGVVAVVSFIMTIGYAALDKWLRETRWS